jgi:hypothetical protein
VLTEGEKHIMGASRKRVREDPCKPTTAAAAAAPPGGAPTKHPDATDEENQNQALRHAHLHASECGGGVGSRKRSSIYPLVEERKLMSRLVRRRICSESESLGRVLEYVEFMWLKSSLEDYDAEFLSPPPSVDEVWHMHILDTKGYGSWCEETFGGMIHHNIDGGDNGPARDGRRRLTANIAQGDRAIYPNLHRTMWKEEVKEEKEKKEEKEESKSRHASAAGNGHSTTSKEGKTDDGDVGRKKEGNKEGKRVTPEVSRHQTIAARRGAEDDSEFTLTVRTSDGLDIRFRVRRKTRVQQIMDRLDNLLNTRYLSSRLTVYGERLNPSSTIGHYELEDGDQISIMEDMYGC